MNEKEGTEKNIRKKNFVTFEKKKPKLYTHTCAHTHACMYNHIYVHISCYTWKLYRVGSLPVRKLKDGKGSGNADTKENIGDGEHG